ncbi:MAG: adenosylcobinamide-phosphate synthase CbiB [Bacillota bacterium]|nr:adenosylcobinamide-phosphate synthase CbiB [Bacillota bacterium]
MDRLGLFLTALILAGICDWLFGDPPGLPHPVRLLGRVITRLESIAIRLFVSPGNLIFAGFLITAVTAGASVSVVLLVISAAYKTHPIAGFVVETYLIFTVIAGGDLRNHVVRVKEELEGENHVRARSQVAMLVSRDTEMLDENGISKAALESLFENSADGFVSPLFYIALGGPAGAVLFKTVSTLDSMLGHKSGHYYYLGRFPARLDDLLNFIPARLTALLILLAGAGQGRFTRGLKVLQQDHGKHESPNSAWPEAAAAGILNVRLGGVDSYKGRVKERPVINETGDMPRKDDLGKGLSLYFRTTLIAFLLLASLAWWLRYMEGVYF